MSVILFYALLIGGLGLIAALWLGLLIAPIGLIGYRFGPLAGVAFALLTTAVLWRTFQPPYDGVRLAIAPPGMRPVVYIFGMLSRPPVAMILAGMAVSVSGFVLVLLDWLWRKAAK